MTRLQMFTSKFPVCRSLIIASAIWILILMAFYHSLDPEFIESIEKKRVFAEFKAFKLPSEQLNVDRDETISTKTFKTIEVDKIEIKRVKKKKDFGYKSLVTPVSPEILRELGLEGKTPGEGGKGVDLQNVSDSIKQKIDEGWKRHQFNEFVSDLISVRRNLPDPREEYCKQEGLYLPNLPATSVIIIFHNEAWSTLLRSVHSVLDRSPEQLITEVILVDDFSNMPHLKKPLEDYMSQYSKVKILRADKREGLIKARLRGAVVAKAPTLTFLDSHVEVTTGWLEPLLDRIARNSTNVVCPVIDIIEDHNLMFSFQSSLGLQVGGFDWSLTFDWHMVPESEKGRKKYPAEPTRSPTMAGGLFSIDTAFFQKLGMYDPDFDIWGAENLEISFKTWMCGGTLEIIPCSHVGHIFRKISPYKWRPGVDVLRRNTIRLAEVWMDEYSKYYYLRTGFNKGDYGDISERQKLRKDLQCKSFKWYVDNVYPDLPIPDNLAEGYVKNMGLSNETCMDAVVGENDEKGKLQTYQCHYLGGNQFFEYSKSFELKKGAHCVDFNGGDSNSLQLYRCHYNKGNQEWIFNATTSQLIHRPTKMCLTSLDNFESLSMLPCNSTELKQKWIFQYLYKEKFLH